MDGVFVPNISFGFPVLKAIKKHAKKTIDVHLMIVNPDQYIEEFAKSGADVITVHYEACPHLHRTIQLIHSFGLKAGVALNPHTDVSVLNSVIKDIDMVLIMSVNPGFGGQNFIPSVLDKISTLRQSIDDKNLNIRLEVDGGIKLDNIAEVSKAGADTFVSGSAIFREKNYQEVISKMRQSLN